MGVHGPGSPNEPVAAPATDTPEEPGIVKRGPPLPGAVLSEIPGVVKRGIGRGPALVVSTPVPVTRIGVEPVTLASALVTLDAQLNKTAAHDLGKSFFYFAVADVLSLKTGDTSDQAIGDAADGLVRDWLKDKATALKDKKSAPQIHLAAANLRAASDRYREYVALESLRKDFSKNPAGEDARDANVVDWIKPHKNETATGYELGGMGDRVFIRLSTAASGLAPDKAARLMARLYDSYQKPDSDDIALHATSREAIDTLEKRLQGATPSPDLDRAKALIAAYRRVNS